MTTDELNAIVQAVMTELEKAGVDFDFKAEVPQADDLVYVMRGTADKYQGITVKWQNLLDIIVQKATEARDDAISAKDIALQTLATIQGIESNVSSMKSSVDASEANVASMKASVEASEANVTQMKASVEAAKSDVEGMKTSVEATKTEVEGLLDTKADVTYVDGELAKKVNYTDSLSYEEIMASTDLSGKVASAQSVKDIGGRILTGLAQFPQASGTGPQTVFISYGKTLPNKPKAVFLTWADNVLVFKYCQGLTVKGFDDITTEGFKAITNRLDAAEIWYFHWLVVY